MKAISEQWNAKLRVRGLGSGFLEGPERVEATVPLQIHVSCRCFTDYAQAVFHTGRLLSDLYKHHKRYRKMRGLDPVPVAVTVRELRRDDHGINLMEDQSRPDKRVPKQPSAKATVGRLSTRSVNKKAARLKPSMPAGISMQVQRPAADPSPPQRTPTTLLWLDRPLPEEPASEPSPPLHVPATLLWLDQSLPKESTSEP